MPCQTIKKNILLFPTFALLLFFLLEAGEIRVGIREGLMIAYLAVVPSVFPFAVLSGYLMGQIPRNRELLPLRPIARLLGLPPGGAMCFLIGQLCGFPLGAKCISDGYQNGLFTKEEAERMLMFSNNTGPAFMVGAVGGMLGSAARGWALFGIQSLLSLTVALLTRRRYTAHPPLPLSAQPVTFTQAVKGGVNATLTVLGFLLFSSACISVMKAYLPSYLLLPLVCLLEVSTAVHTAAAVPYDIVWCAFAVCFSGISVHLQTAAVLGDSDLSMRRYLLSKVLCGIAAAALTYLVFYY